MSFMRDAKLRFREAWDNDALGFQGVWRVVETMLKSDRRGAMASWVYIHSERNPDLFTVGFYDGDGKWQPESDHATSEAAADRVHFLNGGTK